MFIRHYQTELSNTDITNYANYSNVPFRNTSIIEYSILEHILRIIFMTIIGITLFIIMFECIILFKCCGLRILQHVRIFTPERTINILDCNDCYNILKHCFIFIVSITILIISLIYNINKNYYFNFIDYIISCISTFSLIIIVYKLLF